MREMPDTKTMLQTDEEATRNEEKGEEEFESLLSEEGGLSTIVLSASSKSIQIPNRDYGVSSHRIRRAPVIVTLLMIAAAGGVGFSLGLQYSPGMKQDLPVAGGYGELGDDVEFGTQFDNVSTDELQNYSLPILHVPPKRIHLLGERNSGTNYIESILKSAFYPQYGAPGPYPFGGCSQHAKPPQKECIPVFRFKYMFHHAELNDMELEELRTNDSILWVLVVRSPCDWADAMYRKPWHMCPANDTARCQGIYIGVNKGALAGMDRASFFGLPWRDNAEASNEQNFTYPNVFSLRSHKLNLMRQLMRVAPHRVTIAHLKSVEEDPERFIQDIATQFKIQIGSIHGKQQASTQKHRTLCLTDDEWAIAQQETDWDLEGHFGFNALDCHACVRRQ